MGADVRQVPPWCASAFLGFGRDPMCSRVLALVTLPLAGLRPLLVLAGAQSTLPDPLMVPSLAPDSL